MLERTALLRSPSFDFLRSGNWTRAADRQARLTSYLKTNYSSPFRREMSNGSKHIGSCATAAVMTVESLWRMVVQN